MLSFPDLLVLARILGVERDRSLAALGLPVMWLLADLKVMEKPGTVWMLAELGAYG